MSTQPTSNPALPAPAPSSPLSAELQAVLDFTSTENQKHRDYFSDLYKWTAGALTVLILAVGILVGFVGWHTIGDIEKEAKSATDAEIANIRQQSRNTLAQQTEQIQRQISSRLNDEFASPKIRSTIEEAARQQTSGALMPIITREVKGQVTSRVNGEQENVKAALLQQVHASVEELKPTINDRVDKTVAQSVSAKVDSQISPRIQQLEGTVQLSSLINNALAGDGPAYDTLMRVATTPNMPNGMNETAMKVVESIILQHGAIRPDREFSEPKTEPQLVELLKDGDPLTREAAVENLNQIYWKGHMGDLYAIMTGDPSLNVRSAAYFRFSSITGFRADPLDNFRAAQWWVKHRDEYSTSPKK